MSLWPVLPTPIRTKFGAEPTVAPEAPEDRGKLPFTEVDSISPDE